MCPRLSSKIQVALDETSKSNSIKRHENDCEEYEKINQAQESMIGVCKKECQVLILH